METWGCLPLRWAHMLWACALAALTCLAHGTEAPLAQRVRELAMAAAPRAGSGVTRVEVEVGEPDPRLRLAPCQDIQPHLPVQAHLWGRTRVGLRCVSGPVRWNVYLPVTVKVYGPAVVAAQPLAAGRVVEPADLVQAEVDLAEDPAGTLHDLSAVVGRTLSRAVAAGQPVRPTQLRPRQWFAAGDTVKVVALGAGFHVAGAGQALTPGLEGQPARIRTDSGRILTGMPAGDRRVELAP
jgi:flagellar basal body P-ring formation protein FlgA